MHSIFLNIFNKINSHKTISFLSFIFIVLSLAFVATKIEFEEDITKLIPVDEHATELQKVLKQVNFADKIIVNIKKESQGSKDDLVAYADAFLNTIDSTSNDYITDIQGIVGDDVMRQTFDFAYHNLPLLLEQSDYESIAQKINNDSINAITQRNYKTLISPSGLIAKKNMLRDPLGLSFKALKKLQSIKFGNDFSVYNGYLLSNDENHILLFISPTYKSSETDKNATLVENLYTLNTTLNTKFNTKVSAEYFGGALVAVANANQIKSDIQLTMSIALSILIVILILFYKKLLLPLILFIPTALGALTAIVFLYFIRTKISAISLGIGSILLGVTLDYALHILTHIRSNSETKALYKEITKPILMSSLTTALAFLCLLFIKSQALQDLGIFAAVSVLSSSVFALIIIPQWYKNKSEHSAKSTLIDKVASYNFHKSKILFGSLVVLIVVCLFSYNKIAFNKDINKLNYQPQHLVEANERLEDLINSTSKSVYISTFGESEEIALKANEHVFQQLEKLKNNNEIIEFSSIGTLIESKSSQDTKIQQWNTFWNSQRINKLQELLESNGSQFGFKLNTFEAFYNHLDYSFQSLSVNDYDALPFVNVEDYISKTEDFVTVSTLVKINNEKVNNLIQNFESTPNTVLIDRKGMNETFLGNLKTDFNRLVLYSFIVVLLVLLLFYRSVPLTLVTVIPIGLTWMVTIGLMGLLGIEFNIFNIIISTFIFGLGVDYCIFITNGMLHNYKYGTNVLPTYKTSILLSVITTLLGVGVLVFAKHPALYSIAAVCLIGILSAIVMSFTFQPILFKMLVGSQNKRPNSLRVLIHSIISFGYFGLGGLVLSLFSVTVLKIIPISKKKKMNWFHAVLSKFKKSVLFSNPFIKTSVLNPYQETFKKQSVMIANHSSFLDILVIGMLHPKIIFLVNDWVYNSPIFGKAVQIVGFYPVSQGIDSGLEHLRKKVEQGYSLMVFPEGTRSKTNKIRRFHKGAFYLSENFKLDIVPILIHGNSEVNPKGSFIINYGTATIKILKRIKYEDSSFGSTYKERTKAISTFFKHEFELLRSDVESATYFHKRILDVYKHKGHDLYQTVKKDLSQYTDIYHEINTVLGSRDHISHVSADKGQLDFLLALNYPDRKIYTYLHDADTLKIVKHNFITLGSYKLSWVSTIDDLLEQPSNVFILDINDQNLLLKFLNKDSITTIILLKEAQFINLDTILEKGYHKTIEKPELIILKQN